MTKDRNIHRVIVLVDSETVTGYRLAGVEVVEANQENAKQKLDDIIKSHSYGLVAVDTGLIEDPIVASARAMRGLDLPIILPLPSLSSAFSEQTDAKVYMSKLVRETVGFDIKL